MIRYIEHATFSKFKDISEAKSAGASAANEDRVFLGSSICAVIDGSTSKPSQIAGGGAHVADLIAEVLAQIDTRVESKRDPYPCLDVERLIAEISSHVGKNLTDTMRPRASAAIVLYLSPQRQLIRVGDCHIAINGQVHLGTKPIDTLLAEVRSLYMHLKPEPDPPTVQKNYDPGRALILPILMRQAALQNCADFPPYGYGCIDGTHVPSAFVEVWDIPIGAEVVLCSDGYIAPAPTMAQAEKELASSIAIDPDCISVIKGTKGVCPGQVSFDDRSYLRFFDD